MLVTVLVTVGRVTVLVAVGPVTELVTVQWPLWRALALGCAL